MTCPKDAYTTDDESEWCRLRMPEEYQRKTDYVCSRPKNHEGLHHAHFRTEKRCLGKWTQEEAVVEAL